MSRKYSPESKASSPGSKQAAIEAVVDIIGKWMKLSPKKFSQLLIKEQSNSLHLPPVLLAFKMMNFEKRLLVLAYVKVSEDLDPESGLMETLLKNNHIDAPELPIG